MPRGLEKATGDPDNDDYVARILTEEARDNSLKYSARGMEAYIPKRPTGAAPKPNTRFLRHIIKETDNHNAALKKKEERESRERMRELRSQTSTFGRRSGKDHHHHHHHRTSDSRDSRRDRRDGREEKYRSSRRRHRSRSPSADRDRSHKSRRKRESRDTNDDLPWTSRRSRHCRSYSRSRSRSRQDKRDVDSRDRRQRSRKHFSSPRKSRSRSPESHRGYRSTERTPARRRSSPSPTPQVGRSEYESDPLEDLVGPLPPKEATLVRSRGRGAYRPNTTSIDAHFAPDYDPTLDIQPDDESLQTNIPTRRPVAGLMTGDDDWELALEALKDRARWKQKGEERLREAGFNNDIVERWKTNASPKPTVDSEGRLNDVKWSTKSEGREWDRGKFVDADGHIDVKATW